MTADPSLTRPRSALLPLAVGTGMWWLSTAIALAAYWPLYERPSFILMAGVTLLVGSAIAVLGALYRWPSLALLGAALAAFLLLGVPLAVPGRAIGGVLPSLDGLLELLSTAALGWKQLLTLPLPVGSYQGLLVPPFLALLAVTVAGLSVLLRAPRGEAAMLGPVLLLLLGLALGPSRAPWALGLVLGLLAVILCGLVWWRWYRRREAVRALVTEDTLGLPPERSERLIGLRAVGVAAAILAAAMLLGTLTAGLLPPAATRAVPRDAIVQPFDPRDYVSPLAGFRRYHDPALAELALLTVSGLPEGARLRLATLDSYDGVVFSVGSIRESSAAGSFTRVPTALDQSAVDGTEQSLEVTVQGYEGLWLPTLGQLESVSFDGDNADALRDSFFYNDAGGSAVVTAPGGLRGGDSYTLRAVLPEGLDRDALAGLVPGTAVVPAAQAVPEQLALTLDGWVRDADTPGERLVAMLEGLAAEGYVSHGVGTDAAPSRSGHGADRLAELLSAPLMVGDEEQYAPTAALMARALGFPARVVVGFAPAPRDDGAGQEVVVRGDDISAWIEINTRSHGWVALDPTPAPRPIPDAAPEEPAQVARPHSPVPPPVLEPNPGHNQIPLESSQDEEAASDPLMAVLLATLAALGGLTLVLLVLLSPFLAIIAAKARRRQLRRRAPHPAQRISGGWREFEDAVLDFGYQTPPAPTRSEVAETVGGLRPLVLASVADRAVFAPERVDEQEATQVWLAVSELTAGMAESRTRRERLRALLSLRSLGGYSVKEFFARERRMS